MDGVGALWGASLCRRIKRKQLGANRWLRARTKRGAGTLRRAMIQILSGKMSPLSVGYIAGRPNTPSVELAQRKSCLLLLSEDPKARIFKYHNGLLVLHLDCSISSHGDEK